MELYRHKTNRKTLNDDNKKYFLDFCEKNTENNKNTKDWLKINNR